MGGNALSLPSVRLTKANFERLSETCLEKLKALYPSNRIEGIQAYGQKESFGDLDVLVESPGYDPFQAAAALGAVEVVRNGPVTSLGVTVSEKIPFREGNVFQVDLIRMEPECFDYAKRYFAFNDLGNLVGRSAHKMGLRHGHDGLWLPLREGDYLFRTILVTRDFYAAMRYLDFDPARFDEGFDTLEDIFQYVVASRYFNREIFLLENRNYKAKVRDRKRATYTSFLTWMEQRPDLPAYPYPEDKASWLPQLFAAFPHVEVEYREALAELEEHRQVKARYNGEHVSQLTGLAHKELGMLMKHFKESFESPQAMRQFVLTQPEAEVNSRLLRLKETLML